MRAGTSLRPASEMHEAMYVCIPHLLQAFMYISYPEMKTNKEKYKDNCKSMFLISLHYLLEC